MLVLPVDVAQVGIGADARQTHQVQEVQRGTRLVSDRALMHFDADLHVEISRELTSTAQVLSGRQKILFGCQSAGALGYLLALVPGPRAVGMGRRTDHRRVDNRGARPTGVADRPLQASPGSFARERMSERPTAAHGANR